MTDVFVNYRTKVGPRIWFEQWTSVECHRFAPYPNQPYSEISADNLPAPCKSCIHITRRLFSNESDYDNFRRSVRFQCVETNSSKTGTQISNDKIEYFFVCFRIGRGAPGTDQRRRASCRVTGISILNINVRCNRFVKKKQTPSKSVIIYFCTCVDTFRLFEIVFPSLPFIWIAPPPKKKKKIHVIQTSAHNAHVVSCGRPVLVFPTRQVETAVRPQCRPLGRQRKDFKLSTRFHSDYVSPSFMWKFVSGSRAHLSYRLHAVTERDSGRAGGNAGREEGKNEREIEKEGTCMCEGH